MTKLMAGYATAAYRSSDYILKNTKLWLLIVYKSKQAKLEKRYISNVLQSQRVYRARIYIISATKYSY